MSARNIVRYTGNSIDLCVFRQDEEAIEAYTRWMNDETILMWLGRNHKTATYLSEKEFAEKHKENTIFNIVTKAGKLIGNCDIKMHGRNANLGICIGEDFGRNKGYGTETIKLLIKFAFNELNAHRVHLTLNGDNERAHRCYLKAGLVDCGVEHECHYYNGKWCDTIHMELLKSDWLLERAKNNIEAIE